LDSKPAFTTPKPRSKRGIILSPAKKTVNNQFVITAPVEVQAFSLTRVKNVVIPDHVQVQEIKSPPAFGVAAKILAEVKPNQDSNSFLKLGIGRYLPKE
jgi:hypothetical protein